MDIPFVLACPRCKTPLISSRVDGFECPQDGIAFQMVDGIWRFLLAEDHSLFQEFMREYETVRMAEGRGSSQPQYYQKLPFEDITGKFKKDWRIRSISFTRLIVSVLQPIEDKLKSPLSILDLGAGNGWLANRLAARGHHLAAVDLLTNDWDGLGALKHYPTHIWAFQATFDKLPFASRQADMVIYNASLHYSPDIRRTLLEAFRVLKEEGYLVIFDSPFYTQPESGLAMVQERQAEYRKRFGFPSDAIPSENFLTFERLTSIGHELGISWNFIAPFYGLGWMLKPVWAKLRGWRQPARFVIAVSKRLPQASSD